MTDNSPNDLDTMAEEFMQSQEKYKRSLHGLLDWQVKKEGHKIALPARMGTVNSYLMSVTLGWVASNVYFARDLPIFKEHQVDNHGPIAINDTTIDDLQQREPDYRRQLPMAIYLATRRHHKFPSLLLVAYQDWVYDKESDKWGPGGKAMEPSLKVEPLDTNASIVDLDVTNTAYFALDGQHRLMAIKGLKDLLDGRLYAKSKTGHIMKGKSKAREEIEEYYEKLHWDVRSLQGILNEVIGIEVIPAVQPNETYTEAVSRLRNVFVDVNENARRLEKGELSLLDDNNGFRIVARTLMTQHRLFRENNDLRVDTKTNQLSEKSPKFTTLTTIVRIAEGYLGQQAKFNEWKDPILDLKEIGSIRPEVTEIQEGVRILAEYFTALETLPSHHEMMQGAEVSKLRSTEEGNILFRPIAQVALSRAIASLQNENNANLEDIIRRLARHEKEGGLKLTNKTSPWFGILCDPTDTKIRRKKHFEDLCERMFVYLLGGGLEDPNRREDLRRDFFEARRGSSDSQTSKAHSMSGNLVDYDNFYLPHPWQ